MHAFGHAFLFQEFIMLYHFLHTFFNKFFKNNIKKEKSKKSFFKQEGFHRLLYRQDSLSSTRYHDDIKKRIGL